MSVSTQPRGPWLHKLYNIDTGYNIRAACFAYFATGLSFCPRMLIPQWNVVISRLCSPPTTSPMAINMGSESSMLDLGYHTVIPVVELNPHYAVVAIRRRQQTGPGRGRHFASHNN